VRARDQGVDHVGQVGRLVGVVAVDHHVDIGIDIGEGAADDVALARDVLLAHYGTGFGGALRGAIARAVVVDVDRDAGNGGLEVADDLGDGDLLVVAGNDRRDPGRFFVHSPVPSWSSSARRIPGQAKLSIIHRYAPDVDIGLRRRKMLLDSAPASFHVHRFVISAEVSPSSRWAANASFYDIP